MPYIFPGENPEIRVHYVAHFQIDSLSVGYFLRLSSNAWMVVLRPPLVVMRHEQRRPRRASRISPEDSWREKRNTSVRSRVAGGPLPKLNITVYYIHLQYDFYIWDNVD